jgi:L-ascorbate metabolism protein UlaG (beta-lactamase superfamily)
MMNIGQMTKPRQQISLTKRLAVISIALFLLVKTLEPAKARAQVSREPSPQGSVVLKWLGNAGWEIQIGQTIILIDPFLTRGEANPNAEWKTDEAAVLRVVKRADYIFAGHSHADHIADIPFIAKKFGPKVIGSRTTTNIALTAGVDKSQLITISGGENPDFKEFSVQVIESVHGALVRRGRKVRPKFEEITRPWSGPILGSSFIEGGCYLYSFTFGKLRLLHQSSGGFIEDNLAGLRSDIALLYPMDRNDSAEMLKALQPKTVYVHHFDEWRNSISEGMPESHLRRAQRFVRDVTAIDKQIKVVIPKFFETYALE